MSALFLFSGVCRDRHCCEVSPSFLFRKATTCDFVLFCVCALSRAVHARLALSSCPTHSLIACRGLTCIGGAAVVGLSWDSFSHPRSSRTAVEYAAYPGASGLPLRLRSEMRESSCTYPESARTIFIHHMV